MASTITGELVYYAGGGSGLGPNGIGTNSLGYKSYGAGGGYDLEWWVVPAGGDLPPSGGGYTLMGAAGQPESHAVLAGKGYEMTGGFWIGSGGGGGATLYLYLPVILKDR